MQKYENNINNLQLNFNDVIIILTSLNLLNGYLNFRIYNNIEDNTIYNNITSEDIKNLIKNIENLSKISIVEE